MVNVRLTSSSSGAASGQIARLQGCIDGLTAVLALWRCNECLVSSLLSKKCDISPVVIAVTKHNIADSLMQIVVFET